MIAPWKKRCVRSPLVWLRFWNCPTPSTKLPLKWSPCSSHRVFLKLLFLSFKIFFIFPEHSQYLAQQGLMRIEKETNTIHLVGYPVLILNNLWSVFYNIFKSILSFLQIKSFFFYSFKVSASSSWTRFRTLC